MALKFMRTIIKIFLLLLIFVPLLQGKDNPIRPENLGPEVNSRYDERSPVISPDGKTLYFVRQGDPNNVGMLERDQDIWYSILQPDGTWSAAQNIGRPLNTPKSNAVMSASPDGNSLLLFGNYDPNTPYNGAAMTFRTGNGWSTPLDLKIDSLHNYARWYQFFLANNGEALFMSIQADSIGETNDLYVSLKLGPGHWGKPINLGNTINTDGNELSPFLASDERTLYFSTNGRPGYGDYDIYFSRRIGKGWQNWTEPKNLGPLINTPGFEAYFKIPASGDYAYYSSSNNSIGQKDIFRILLPDSLRPLPSILVYGKVINSITKQPLGANIKYELLPSGAEQGTAISDNTSGNYKIVLPAGYNYGYRAEAHGFLGISDNISLDTVTRYKEIRRDLELIPINQVNDFVLKNVFFDFNSYVLEEKSFPELNRVANFINTRPDMDILITGYTDSIGSESYNRELSLERAWAVKKFLQSKGIDGERISISGQGEAKPAADNNSEEGRSKNRRVEFKFINKLSDKDD